MLQLVSRWHVVAVAVVIVILSVAQLMRFYANDIDVLSFASSREKQAAHNVDAATAAFTHTVYSDPQTITRYLSAQATVTETIINVVETPAPTSDEDNAWCSADFAADVDPVVDADISFKVPKNIVYNPAGPRPDQVVILTATDGHGHNGGIENIIELAAENRKAYCAHHGYRYHFVNISKFDLGDAHPVWKKLPAIVDSFNTYPDAQWVFWLDLDAIIMTPTQDLNSLLLSHAGMRKSFTGGSEPHSPVAWQEPDFADVDMIVAQDHNGLNAGSFFLRRSEWTRWMVDMWADPYFMYAEWEQKEQQALVHFSKHHTTFREHVAMAKQRTFNAFIEGGPSMKWVKGDLLVHLAGCWTVNRCKERWQEAWDTREVLP